MSKNTIVGQLPLRPKIRKFPEYHALVNQGEYSAALQAVRKTLEMEPDDLEALRLAFKSSTGLGDWKSALDYVSRLCKLKPDIEAYSRQKAMTLSNAKRYREALSLAESLYLKDTRGNRDISILDLLKICHYHLGNHHSAFEYGQIALCTKDQIALAGNNEGKAECRPANGKRNVISYSLWGEQKSYQYGAMINSVLVKYIYSGWHARFYVGKGVSDKTIAFLEKNGSEVVMANERFKHIPGYFWRFLVMADNTVNRFLCRDCDCRLSPEELFLVNEWIESGKGFHVMRNHILHNDLILAGLWGGTAIDSLDLEHEITRYFDNEINNDYHHDQLFLGKVIWPRIREHTFVHDSTYRLHGVLTSNIKPNGFQHIGVGHRNEQSIIKEMNRFSIPTL